VKPFECVGGPEEVIAAFFLVQSRGNFSSSLAMKLFEATIASKYPSPSEMIDSVLQSTENHVIPEEYVSVYEAF
jgi:hypothetical protein